MSLKATHYNDGARITGYPARNRAETVRYVGWGKSGRTRKRRVGVPTIHIRIVAWKRSEGLSNGNKVTAGSGNVFADLGFANPEEELLKAKLIREIRSIIKRRR